MKSNEIKTRKITKRPGSARKEPLGNSNKELYNAQSHKEVLASSTNEQKSFKRSYSKVHTNQNEQVRPTT